MDSSQNQIPLAFTYDRFLLRKKIFSLLGMKFHLFDPEGNTVLFTQLKAFKLKEDIRIYATEAMDEELIRINARSVIDFGATYDVVDSKTGDRLGALRRKGLKSMVRDEWEILDVGDRPLGKIQEDSAGLALLRRFLTNLVPQTFIGHFGDQPVFRFKQTFNPLMLKMELDFSVDEAGQLDRRIGLAASFLIAAIEGRQG